MKKIAITVMVIMLIFLASAVIAGENGKTGKLFLFQKCDGSLISKSGYDSFGCPDIRTGPWPIFRGNGRRGTLEYSLWAKEFAFSFEGQRLLPEKNYTLIYYPDPWPGAGLICLGSGKTDRDGNIEINGGEDIGTSLPASYDANFSPVYSSGAVGAKIWLVLTDDVQCTNVAKMLNWNPSATLFEYNLIVYENSEIDFEDNENDLNIYTASTVESLNNGSQSDATGGVKSSQVQAAQAKPIISASPKSVNFGSVRVGSTSDPKTVTIKNTGNEDLIVDSVNITGTDAAEFSQTNSCSTIQPKSRCALTVTFIPAVPFAKKNAVMTISCNDPKKPSINVKLLGKAPPPKISVSPKSAKFGSIAAGRSSTLKTVTIKNTGISDLAVNSITIAGTNAVEFSQTNNCTVVAKGSSCAIAVTLSPTSAGSKTALMSISSNDPKKLTINVKLSGKGSGGSTPLAVDITGNWNTYHTVNGTPGEQGPELVTYTQTGSSITGTTAQGTQVTGSLSGLNITMSWNNGEGATITATGTVSANVSTMSGTWTDTKGESGTWRATRITFFYVYKDYAAVENHFIPSGWMGDGDFVSAISFNDTWVSNCQSGSCIKISFNIVSGNNWAGIYWQDPKDNWGSDSNGGFNLAACTRIDFMARGEKGGEQIEFFTFGIGRAANTGASMQPHPDSSPKVSAGYKSLSQDWQAYSIDITGKDLTHVIGGFGWATDSSHNPQGAIFYLDEIKYECSS